MNTIQQLKERINSKPGPQIQIFLPAQPYVLQGNVFYNT